jgi:hypothetical protein
MRGDGALLSGPRHRSVREDGRHHVGELIRPRSRPLQNMGSHAATSSASTRANANAGVGPADTCDVLLTNLATRWSATAVSATTSARGPAFPRFRNRQGACWQADPR